MNIIQVRKQLELMQLQAEKELGIISTVEEYNSGQGYQSSRDSREDTAVMTVNLEKRTALQNQKITLLGEINHALQKLEGGSYGVCDHCSQPIEKKRLEALPYASLCVRCKAAGARKNMSSVSGS